MKAYKVAVIPGDGIGKEVVPEGQRVLEAAAKKHGFALAEAQRLGYRRLVLDTLKDMTAAQALYRTLGFSEIDAYYTNPLPGVRYFQMTL